MKTRILGTLALPLLIFGCLEGTSAPSGADNPEIRLRVSGGFAGVDYVILVDGSQREVIGEACTAGCGFEDGDILHGLSEDQLSYMADMFLEAGIHGLDGTDSGVECCDQFYYELRYADGSGTSEVKGSSEALPTGLREAIGAVAGFASEVVPVILAPHADMESWQKGFALFEEWVVRGDFLDVTVTHTLGCGPHHMDLVVYGGWMESFPVQIHAFFAADGNGEVCTSEYVTRDVSFDLRPLKQAYQEAYGVGEPGSTTVLILLSHSGTYSSLAWIPVEYVF